MNWTVEFTSKARKQTSKLPPDMQDILLLLINDIRRDGPVCLTWPHYGKLRGRAGEHHCHLNKGKPRYVAVWKEMKGQIKLVEVKYVGTHEKAPY